MRRLSAPILALTVLLVASFAGAGGSGTGTNDCGDGDGGHQLTWTPTSVWPPNHKHVDVTITYTSEDEDNQLTLAATSATHDEMVDGREIGGSGNTGEDVILPAGASTGTSKVETVVRVRGERSGRGDGRTYTLDYDARSMNEDGGEENNCSGQITVSVPHDCRNRGCPKNSRD